MRGGNFSIYSHFGGEFAGEFGDALAGVFGGEFAGCLGDFFLRRRAVGFL